MEFKVGQKWKTRDGGVVTIVEILHNSGDYKAHMKDFIGIQWGIRKGGTLVRGIETGLDLIELIEEADLASSVINDENQEKRESGELGQSEEHAVTAKRFNSGKVDMTLLPTAAMRAEARVWMKGEEKYGRDNWTKLWGEDTINLCMACALRHSTAIMDGELIDEESGQPHAAHIKCNMSMIIHYMVREGLYKD